MKTQEQERLSLPQIISVGAILLGIGVTWTAVVLYRMHVKSIDGEWGNLALASLGLGFGFLTLYAGMAKKKLASFVALGALTSLFLLIALAYYSHAL